MGNHVKSFIENMASRSSAPSLPLCQLECPPNPLLHVEQEHLSTERMSDHQQVQLSDVRERHLSPPFAKARGPEVLGDGHSHREHVVGGNRESLL